MNNKSKFKLSAKKNPNQIDHLGRKQIEILNQACPNILNRFFKVRVRLARGGRR